VNHVSHQPHIPACIALLFVLSCSFATAAAPAAPREGAHDFDFAFGTWKTRVRRLLHPLSGSSEWTEYEGTSIVRRIWNGRGNTVELDVSGAAGRIEGLSLRLYNPHSRQWSLNYASSASGMLGVPTVGAFENRRGEFYDQEPVDGRMVLVRNVITDDTPRSIRFEQAYSTDGGRTWEVNWIAIDTPRDDVSVAD
jgi:hypothetical protein